MDEELSKATQNVFYDEEHHLKKRWKARLFVCVIMLFLAVVNIAFINFHFTGYWFYSQVLSVSYAILSIWLFWYLNRGNHQFSRSTVWRQIFHWIGLLAALYLIDLFVRSGIMSTLSASLVTLMMLALTIYLVGVYSDLTFVFIGIMLAIFVYCLAYVQAYLSIIMIPVILVAAFVIFFIVHHEHRKGPK